MKNVILLLVVVLTLFSCKKEEDAIKFDNSKFNIVLNTDAPKSASSYLKSLSDEDVVKNATVVRLSKVGEKDVFTDVAITKNIEKRKIIISADYIMKADGTFNEDFFSKEDMVILDKDRKIIAYITNNAFRVGETQIKSAYRRGMTDSCQYYLQNFYQFISTTDEIWHDLKANNRN